MIRLASNPFKGKQNKPRTIPFTCRMREVTSERLIFLKKHEGKSKTAIIDDLINAGFEIVKKRRA